MLIINVLFYDSTEFCNFPCSAEPQLTDYNGFLVRCYAFYRISTKRGAEKNAGKPSLRRGDARQLQTFHGSAASQGTYVVPESVQLCAQSKKLIFASRRQSITVLTFLVQNASPASRDHFLIYYSITLLSHGYKSLSTAAKKKLYRLIGPQWEAPKRGHFASKGAKT